MEEIEDVTKVSSKGQVVIPKEIRERLGILPGEKIIVMTRDDEIVLKKARKLRLEELSEKIVGVAERNKIDAEKLIDEAIKWARSKRS
ncbi:MAG: AbrB/MazE/SpoVT family DNA-binding domain-containing protein [Thaumarchaeota archaeon]|nr:AbrB/MazE/SpoVT family DNA-binding domain-containing protein [Nitrososphaerota archaeon]